MSLRLTTFQEQSMEEGQCSTTDDKEGTNEGNEWSGFDTCTELEALFLNFSDNPSSLSVPTVQVLEDLDVPRPLTSPTAFGVQGRNVVDRNTLNDDSTMLRVSSPAEPDFDLLGTQPQWQKLSGFDEARTILFLT